MGSEIYKVVRCVKEKFYIFPLNSNIEFEGKVFKTEIPRRTKIVEAQAMMQDIFTYAPDCDAAQSYEAFAKEIVDTYKDE